MIGHYYYRKTSKDKHFNPSYDAALLPLTNGNFFELVESITPTCPLNKADTGYKQWKQNNLPIVYFTNEPHRPKGDTTNTATGYAMVDVDNLPDVRLECNHPSIVATNHTGNGTHFFIYGVFGDTPQEWQQNYNLYAWEIYNELTKKYGDHQIKLDGHQSQYYWGCYLWGGMDNWVFNNHNDKGYNPAHVALSDEQLNTMYDEDTYWLSGKENATGTTLNNCVDGGELKQRTANAKNSISKDMLNDYKSLRYTDFRSIPLKENAMNSMFRSNARLVDVPDLSGISGVERMGMYMAFAGCPIQKGANLRNIRTVGDRGLQSIYENCSYLSEAYAPSVSSWNTSNMNNWLNGVSATGVVFKPSTLTIPTGLKSGVPTGWTTQDYD